MAEYIEREALLKDLKLLAKHEDAFRQSVILGVVHTIECKPAADVVEVVHGRWKNRAHLNDHLWAECSNCGFRQESYKVVELGRSSDDYVGVRWHYCPLCGARMDGE